MTIEWLVLIFMGVFLNAGVLTLAFFYASIELGIDFSRWHIFWRALVLYGILIPYLYLTLGLVALICFGCYLFAVGLYKFLRYGDID